MVHVGAETDAAKLSAGAVSIAGKLLLAGERGHLMALPPALQLMVADYLFYNWERGELLLRITLAISRKASIAPVAPAVLGVVPFGGTEIPRRIISSPRVLVVDDDPNILALLRTTLRNHGAHCETADNGRDAIRLIREQEPQVVVLDVNMPGMDGYEVLSAIRAEELPTQVILLTARQQERDVLRGFELGADDYLIKPLNPLELLARLKRLSGQTHNHAAA
jgi:CheY-like chemotaxis protein